MDRLAARKAVMSRGVRMIIAGLLAQLANRLAIVRVALHSAALVVGGKSFARTVIAHGSMVGGCSTRWLTSSSIGMA
jgi:hypothetical protein